jgi:catechol 2,3-dioxygenase-like lactoylglutathione lyase family enzyme
MESVISDLVRRFENGALSRRELVRGLGLLAAMGSAATARSQQAPFVSAGIDHISIQVDDLAPSIAFYQDIFGLSILNQDVDNEIVRMGVSRVIVSLHRKAPTRLVDHYAIAIEDFDRDEVTSALAEHGLTPEQNLDYGFHVRDPAGIPVQIVAG